MSCAVSTIYDGNDFANSFDGLPVVMPTNARGLGDSDRSFPISEPIHRLDVRRELHDASPPLR